MQFWLFLLLAQQLPTTAPPPASPPAAPPAASPATVSGTAPAKPDAPEAVPASTPVPLVYQGKPLQVSPSCSEEIIQSLALGCTLDDPCEVYLELASLEVAGNTVVLSGNLHTDLITIDSLLLVSQDAGKTWTEPHLRIRQGVLEQIQFIDFQTGWVAGQVMQTFARDPFLLLTSDGGQTWRRRPLFDDARPGSIEFFHFTSKSQGTLVLDRSKSGDPNAKYESFESSTGGSSWQIREVSRSVIKPKRPLPGNGGWRLRADAALKAFRVEKLTGARWDTVAAFTIRLPNCAPPPPPEPQPETPPEPAAAPAPEPAPAASSPAKPRARPSLQTPPPAKKK